RPAISQTGRFIAFESTATNLTATTTAAGRSHIYLHDRDVSGSGTFDTPGNTSTVLVDTTPAGAEGDNHSIQAALSADGSTIAWTSDATNLVAGDANGQRDVFLRPRTGAGLGTTRLVSVVNGTGAQANGASQTPALSSDGRWIVFASVATNLVAGDTNNVSDIFVYDGAAAVAAPVVTRVSVSSAGAQASDPNVRPPTRMFQAPSSAALTPRSAPTAATSPLPRSPIISPRATPTGRVRRRIPTTLWMSSCATGRRVGRVRSTSRGTSQPRWSA
ncbi:MAG: hypothetical protein RLZZ188_3403, partial [Verrucomicrobiota bacterium]